MFRKIIFLASITMLGLAGYLSAAEPDVMIPTVGAKKPVLDGVVDNLWSLATKQYLAITTEGSEPDLNTDLSGSWSALWDSEYLYILVDVNDDALVQDSPSGWDDDRVEIFIDGDNSKDDAQDNVNDYQYNFRWNYGEVETPVEWYLSPDSLQGVEYAVATTGTGYLFEIALPWLTMIGMSPQVGHLIGIDVMIDDDDDGGGRDTQISWHLESSPPHSPVKWGTAKLVIGSTDKASNPNPTDEQTDVQRDLILKWKPGEFADKHDVYLGTNFDDVNNAETDSPLLVSPAQDVNSYNTGRLEFEQTYFWRVDEINAPPDTKVFKGNIWSFTVEPFTYPIPADSIVTTASSYAEGNGPENTINGSGLVNDLHSTVPEAMWVSSVCEPGSAWIQYEFDKTYKLHQMLVWNYNGPLILWGYGFKDVIVEYSTNDTNWTQIDSVTEFAQAPSTTGYAHNTIVEFNDVAVKFVRITANSNWSNGFMNQYGLSEVRFLHIPVSAREPRPADKATEIAVEVTLGWRAGREADEHNIYLSTDQQAVIDGTVPAVTVPQANYGPLSLELDSIYYWCIDEVNNAETTTIWKGDIWSFMVQEYIVVDDFESYNDITPGEEGSNRIYLTWIDGFENPTTNGSTMGYPDPYFPDDEHFVETNIVHSEKQSTPISYDNSTASYSEVTVSTNDITIGPDWSRSGAQVLVLWFYGDPNNAATEQMYAKINGSKVIYDGNPNNIAISKWTQWNIGLASLGVDSSNVTTFSIGFEITGSTGGSGTVLFDDIRLYKIPPPEI